MIVTKSCSRCGADGASRITIQGCAGLAATGMLCDPCITIANADAAVLREEFEALIAAGVGRDRANRLMIDRLDGKRAQA